MDNTKLGLYFQKEREDAAYAASQRAQKLTEAPCVSYPISFNWSIPSFDALLNRKKASTDISIYDLMQVVLRQVRLVNYEKSFYYLDGSVFKYIAETDLRTLVFQILESVIADGKSPKIIGTAVNVPCFMNGYIHEHELMDSFLGTCCRFHPDCYTPTADLLLAYNAFRTSKNIPPIQDAAFFSRQLNHFCLGRIQSKKRRQGQRSLNGYLGIGLKETVRDI